jgi:hypothetical protein
MLGEREVSVEMINGECWVILMQGERLFLKKMLEVSYFCNKHVCAG